MEEFAYEESIPEALWTEWDAALASDRDDILRSSGQTSLDGLIEIFGSRALAMKLRLLNDRHRVEVPPELRHTLLDEATKEAMRQVAARHVDLFDFRRYSRRAG